MSKREDIILRKISDERIRQFYEGVRSVLFELVPLCVQVAILLACAFVFCGCIVG